MSALASPHRTTNKPRALVLRYGVAVLIVAAAILICLFNLNFSRGTPFLLFYPVPVLAFLCGGLGPGLLAAALSGLAVKYVLLPPCYSFTFQQSDFTRVAIFVGIQIALCLLLDSRNNQLRQSEARFRSLYEHAAVGIVQVAPDGRLLMVNPALCRMLGYSESELLSKRFVDITHPDDREREATLLEAMFRGDLVFWEIEERYLHRDGSPVWVSLTSSVVKDGDGQPLYRILIIQDIGERKRAEEALRIGEQRLAAVIDNAMDAIITIDENQRVVLFNAAAEKIFGCPASEVLGKPLDRFLPERFRAIHPSHIRTFGATGKSARSMHAPATLYGQRANGEEFPFEATISQASIAGQELYTVILRDVTQREQAEELARLYAQSQEMDQLKTEFFANISHELRTPLALILGPVRKRLAAGGMGEAERRDLELVERNAGTLLRHVNDLLDLSKLDAGRMKADYEATDLARLGRLVASNFESLAKERGLRYLIDIPSSLPAQVDPRKIERVLLNLLSNAFKFTPAGGSVRLAIHQETDRAVVEVEDSGIGIPPHMREAVFERFRQIEGGSNRKFGGTGLGLSIAKQLVTLHGGSIAIGEAGNGGGSLFRVELPLVAPAGSKVQEPAEAFDQGTTRQVVEELAVRNAAWPPSRAAGAASAPLVLVVEDNSDMNAFISETLSASYRTVAAFDGQEGLNKALELRPDLILCDVMMPGMSGDQLVRELRKRQELDDVPIVLLTAKADDRLLVQLLKEGAQDYLQKPFAAEQLLAKMERLIADRRRVAEELERLQKLSGHLLEEDDHERRQIAHDLHENTAQYLAALGMNLALARDTDVTSPKVQRILTEGLSLLELCMSDIHTMSYALHPSLLDHFGLGPAIDWHVKSFVQSSGIEVSVEVPADFGRLPAESELALFRIMQEALANVRHSGSKKARVRVFRDALEVGLEVSDEGGGMLPPEGQTPEYSMHGIGIEGMRERAKNLGGRLEIDSGPNGTKVRAMLPFVPHLGSVSK
jgi:PAS domain S-box-containing protein